VPGNYRAAGETGSVRVASIIAEYQKKGTIEAAISQALGTTGKAIIFIF
jgi:hypothetical protein